jgi:hypothetical protein
LNLDAASSYAQLINITSIGDAGLVRVAPFDPVNSYLVQRLEGTDGVMPPTGMIAQSSIDTIRTWIANGAIDDRVVVLNPIRVVSLSPAPNTNLQAGPASIIAGFDRDLDPSTVNAMTFILEGSGPDGVFNSPDDVQIAPGPGGISVPAMNPATAVFDLTGVVLADDTYRVRLLGNGGSVIQDMDANALDGEFGGMFPTGNTVAGGDFVAQFIVQAPVVIGPTLDQIQTVVFTPTCATVGCHTGAGAAGGLNLSDADTSFLELVGVPSSANAAINRVTAGDPDNSYLIQKLEGNALPIMPPPPRQPLPATDILEIRNWITNGADRNN